MANSFKVAAMFGAMVVSFFVSFGTAEAQEKGVATGTETAQVAENVEAQAMAVTVETLIAKWAMEKALRKSEEIEVMVEPVDSKNGVSQSPVPHYYNGPGANETQINGGVLILGNWSDTGFSTGFDCSAESLVPCILMVPYGKTLEEYIEDDLDNDAATVRAAASFGRNVTPDTR